MIRPDTGSRWKVSGSSIAMVAIGPMPGSTPIKVPTMAPTKAKPRLAGVSATPKPMARLSKNSIAYHSGQTGMVSPSPKMKMPHDSSDQRERGDGGLERAQARVASAPMPVSSRMASDEAEPLDAQAERDQAERHRQHRAPRLRRRAQRRGLLPQSLHQHDRRRGRAAASTTAAACSRCPCAARCRPDSCATPTARTRRWR